MKGKGGGRGGGGGMGRLLTSHAFDGEGAKRDVQGRKVGEGAEWRRETAGMKWQRGVNGCGGARMGNCWAEVDVLCKLVKSLIARVQKWVSVRARGGLGIHSHLGQFRIRGGGLGAFWCHGDGGK